MRYALVFAAGFAPAFLAGWVTRGLFDRHPLGERMKRQIDAVLGWIGTGHRWLIPYLVVLVLALSALAYTFAQDQDAEDRERNLIACLATYVDEMGGAQAERTAASVRASDARRDYDAAPPGPVKDALLAEYLRLYDIYVEVREGNPYPRLSEEYCEAAR